MAETPPKFGVAVATEGIEVFECVSEKEVDEAIAAMKRQGFSVYPTQIHETGAIHKRFPFIND